MSKKKGRALAFKLGDPEPVLSSNPVDYLGVFYDTNRSHYEPPVSLQGLAKLLHANTHHASAIYFKRNQLTKYYRPTSILPMKDFKAAAFERFLFGQCYLQVKTNRLGQILGLRQLPGLNMRRMQDKDRFCLLQPGGREPIKFKRGEVWHLKEYDVMQHIYGIPEYLAALQALLLNESSTLFRRKYYLNGAHVGYILYTADANLDEDDEESLKKAISESKGVGNFRSMFLNIPGGRPDSVKIIPVGDIATKDEFERVKNITRNDIIAMHRVPPALSGIMPETNGGFGDIQKITDAYYENETKPNQSMFLELNERLPANKWIQFDEP